MSGTQRLEFVLPAGPVHGDASIGNIIRRQADGVAVLIDLDGFASGPREWDLVLTAMYFERFGWHTAQEYREFVDGLRVRRDDAGRVTRCCVISGS